MKKDDKDWFVSYHLHSDGKRLVTTIYKAFPQFGEVAEYTIEEATKVCDFLKTLTVEDSSPFGWEKFKQETNIKIKQLLNERI